MTGPTVAIYFRLGEADADALTTLAAADALTATKFVKKLVLDRLAEPLLGKPDSHSRVDDPPVPAEVLTIEEAADFLRVPSTSLSHLLENGRMPGRAIGDGWRISRGGLVEWLGAQPR